ncbi:MAG: hypothetical protein U1E97_05115 [Alphaproteobacteria bacterium]
MPGGRTHAPAVARCHDLEPHLAQSVLQGEDRLFVAGDHPRREHHHVAAIQADRAEIPGRDARQGGPRLALASRADNDDLAPRDGLDFVFGQKLGQPAQVARFARRLDHPPERASDQRNLSPMLRRGMNDAFQARNVAGETGNDDPLAVFPEQLDKLGPDAGLGPRLAGDQGVGQIADQGQHPFPANRLELGLVGHVADQGVGVDLPITGMQDKAGPGANGQGIRLGDRMGQRDQFDIERADPKAAAERDLVQGHLIEKVGFAKLPAQERRGERGCIDRSSAAPAYR